MSFHFWFFQQLGYLLNVLGMSCKKNQMFREAQADYLIEALQLEEIEAGTGQNQEMGVHVKPVGGPTPKLCLMCLIYTLQSRKF